MLPHVFSHQQQYPSNEPSWQHLQHQSQPSHAQHLPHHAQVQHQAAQAAAAAAQAAQQQHYNRIAAGGGGNPPNGSNGGLAGPGAGGLGGAVGQDERHGAGGVGSQGGRHAGLNDVTAGISMEEARILEWMAQLLNSASREAALLELSKKREQFPQLALILWHSFGMSRPGIGVRDLHNADTVLLERSDANLHLKQAS
jgi:CCR4-NOT transcription complex subunit 9